MDTRVTVLIATRNRRAELAYTLDRLRSLPEAPRVIVADNGSSDGTTHLLEYDHPWVRLIPIGANIGAAARTVAAREAESPYVAFCDDDSWWAPGSLAKAADLLDSHASLALIAARVLVGDAEELDPTCAAMAASPLHAPAGSPGTAILGFLACGAVVRRSAFLDLGGFEPRYGVGGEEELLAIDLASAGWGLAYCEGIVAHHKPGVGGPRPGRRRVEVRNSLWTTWMRRPLRSGLRRSVRLVARGTRDAGTWLGAYDALRRAGWALSNRRRVPRHVEMDLLALDDFI